MTETTHDRLTDDMEVEFLFIPKSEAQVAAAEVHDGAMIAFIPNADDVRDLVLPDGEPLEQFHITSFYLGNAVDFDDDVRADIHEVISEIAASMPIIEVDVFGFSIWNPLKEPCLVADIGDRTGDLVGAQDEIIDALMGMDEPYAEQHQPWRPHMTIRYGALQIPVELYAQVGTIQLDRIRVAFGGVITDYPLGAALTAAHAFHLPGKHAQKSHGHGGGEAMHTGSKKELQKAREKFDGQLSGARTGGEAMGSVPLGVAWGDDSKTVGGVNNGEVSAAVSTYAGSTGYYDVNEGLRRSHGDPKTVVKPPPNPGKNSNAPDSPLQTNEDVRATIDTMDRGMAASHVEHDVVVHRMISEPEHQFGSSYRHDGDNTGLSWRDHAYTSTSAVGMEGTLAFQGSRLRGGFEEAGKPMVMMRIVIPKGQSALLGRSGLEGEIILPHDTEFRIVRDNGNVDDRGRAHAGTRFVDVEIIG